VTDVSPVPDRAALLRAGRRLSLFTVLWNAVEGIVSIVAGVFAGSIALVGFGVDSFVETSSGAVMLWRFQPRADRAADERAEARALRLVGLSLLALAAYVVWEAGTSLLRREGPEASVPGIVIALVSLGVMPVLARRKRRVAAALGSRALEADSFQTTACTYLSAILLVGLVLNALFGLWWADPVAALAMVPILVSEGRGALRGVPCDDCGVVCDPGVHMTKISREGDHGVTPRA
jgi:divalent metal cation (Fe/Co/Zn/Cd) transporter